MTTLKVKDLKEILEKYFNDEDDVVILRKEGDNWKQKIVTQVARLQNRDMDNDAIALHSASELEIDISVAAKDFKKLYFGL
jgi:hypothetical protein